MIITIFGSIGALNLGDELILKNQIKILEKKYSKKTKFIVFSYNHKNPFFKKSNIFYKEYFPIGIKKINNLPKNFFNFLIFIYYVIKSDLIVIGGGGIIYDNEKQSNKDPLNQWIFRKKIFDFFKKKVLFFCVGLNIKNIYNYKKIKKIFSKSIITVRDNYSYELLKSLGIESTKLIDPVFEDKKDNFIENLIIKKVKSFNFSYKDLEGINIKGKKIAIAFRRGFLDPNSDNEYKKINDLLDYILSKGGEIIFLPHSFHKTDYLSNDYLFLKTFIDKDLKNIRIISSMQDVYNKYIYKEFDICLAMRYHSIILSQVYGIPFIGISYSKKTDEVLNYIENYKNGIQLNFKNYFKF